MRIGTRNPHHRRSALLQLALCGLAVLAMIPIAALTGTGPWPGTGRHADGTDNGLIVAAVWILGTAQLAFQGWAAWRYLHAPSTARVAFGISSVLILAAYPVGTAIGLYSLWVLLRIPVVPERAHGLPEHELA